MWCNFFAIVFLAFSLASFRFSYAYTTAFRAFYGLYGSIEDVCVVNINDDGTAAILPYFNIVKARYMVSEYLRQRLESHCQYTYFVNGTRFQNLLTFSNPMGMEIKLTCSIMGMQILDKTATFAIERKS